MDTFLVRPNKKISQSVFRVTGLKILGRVDTYFFYYFFLDFFCMHFERHFTFQNA